MSQQFDFPPPPPTSSPGNGGFFPSSLRRRPAPASPPSLTTSFLRAQGAGGPSQTPASAVNAPPSPYLFPPATPSAFIPRSPAALHQGPQTAHPGSQVSTPATPTMATQTYNPMQWTQRGHGTGSHVAFQGPGPSYAAQDTRDVTGMEHAMPSPPPPYSPDTPPAGAQLMDNILSSPVMTQSPYPMARQEQTPSFAPPPGPSNRQRERSTSGLAGRLASLAARNRPPVDSHQSTPIVHAPMPVPPAARRAASTGHIPAISSSNSPAPQTRRDSPDGSSWQPGMPLPPPPPCPPPAGARSQSLNRVPTSSSTTRSGTPDSQHAQDNPVRRRAQAPTLGTVPPTPANWVDDDLSQSPAQAQLPNSGSEHHTFTQPLRIDTGSSAREQSLTRRPARRDPSAQGIRERRSRSRAAREAQDNDSGPSNKESKPSDLILPANSGSISQRREHNRTASGYLSMSPLIKTHQDKQTLAQRELTVNVLTPPYTPAVGTQSSSAGQRRSMQAPGSAMSERSVSHQTQTSTDDAKAQAPTSPGIPLSRPPSNNSLRSSKLDSFALQALERHRKFIEKETAATSDEERLELFANFVVHESRIRRDRYYTAYNGMAADIGDLTRDMWRSYERGSKRAATPSTMSSYDPTVPSWASDGQPASARGGIPSSATSLEGLTPGTDVASFCDPSEALETVESRQWDRSFKPSLSPIPSMAQSSLHDEGSSRGRTQARWWESDSGSIGRPDRIEKSRRETKYMGVNPTMLQDSVEPSPVLRNTPTPGASFSTRKSAEFGPDEYPPEKVGWHDADVETPMATPAHRKPSTPGLEPLDVSRLVTLPPPYPRHHPAINNSHPLLADLRNEHRAVAEIKDIEQIKETYQAAAASALQVQSESEHDRKSRQRAVIQENVMNGRMSFADAARAEAEFEAQEAERNKTNAKSNFETFETTLAHPLNTLLNERIARADDCIKRLRGDLEIHDDNSSPDQAQEEGDERPERLEKLTLLKWLFEARELLHKDMYELHAKRSDLYSEVVLAPYRSANDHGKVEEITSFFTKDKQERQISFARDCVKRVEELHSAMNRGVSRGVEDQLSAFWDIAPGLLDVIQKVPDDMAALDVFVPPQEYEENPIYATHPLQYLYTVLSHAEKSTYQFIESQTNLLCLLHEVRTAITKSNLRLVELERSSAKPDDVDLKAKMNQARREEEDKLTKDLQEKVGEVERQWREALGEGLEDCKGRVKNWLEESGGWDDALEE